jgi:hypothetical protein
MALQQTTRTYLDFIGWLRRCRHFWSHYLLRSVVLETKEGPRALWTDIVLTDSKTKAPVAPKGARDIKIISSTGKYAALPHVLRSLRSGVLPPRATGQPKAIRLSWKADDMIAVSQFSLDTSPEAFGIRGPASTYQEWGQYPRGILTFELGLLSSWSNGHEGRYPWLLGLDDQARRTGCRDLFDLGTRAGLLGDVGVNSSANAVPQLRVIAPFLIRISGASVDREAGELTVEVTRSKHLTSRRVAVTLAETDQSGALRPAIKVPAGSKVTARFKDIKGGHAELRLHDSIIDSYSRRQGILREPFRRSARSAITSVLEGGLAPLRTALEKAQGTAVEPALTRLLILLGWSAISLSRNASQPSGVREGIMRFDVLAFGHRDTMVLAVECSSDWFGDDKLAKLVTRAREVESVLGGTMAVSDIPRVQPVVVVTKARKVAPPHLLLAAEKHAVGVIAREDLLDLVEYLAASEPHRALNNRFAACFPQGSWLGPPNIIQEIGKYETW